MEYNIGDKTAPCLTPFLTWAYGVVVSMFDFHCSDRGSNPGRGGKNFIMFTTT